MRYLSLILIAITIFFNQILSQNLKKPQPYISISPGIFISSKDNFEDTYDSKFGINFSGSLGFPIFSKIYPFFKVNYFSKSNDGASNSTFGIKSASFKQWIMNGGIEYRFIQFQLYQLYIDVGISYTSIKEEIERISSHSTINGKGLLGYFIGFGIERKFNNKSLSIFTETEFNISREDIKEVIADYGGINISLGIRYYFKLPKK